MSANAPGERRPKRVVIVDDSPAYCDLWSNFISERYPAKVVVETYSHPYDALPKIGWRWNGRATNSAGWLSASRLSGNYFCPACCGSDTNALYPVKVTVNSPALFRATENVKPLY